MGQSRWQPTSVPRNDDVESEGHLELNSRAEHAEDMPQERQPLSLRMEQVDNV